MADMAQLRDVLKKVDFFYSLSFAELDELINALKKRPARRGETIIKQGERGDTFYLISKGSVSVYVKKGLFGKKQVAELGEGDFFGEMALVSDEPRSATVIADEDSEVFVLYKKDFKQILLSNPKIAGIIKQVLTERKMKNRQ